jgi:excinuclease ABC subunit B
MYADKETESMKRAFRETERRREIQVAYNKEHGITPETVRKGISDMAEFLAMDSSKTPRQRRRREERGKTRTPEELERLCVELEEEMAVAAEDLRFEEAARIRDELKELRADLDAIRT